MGRRRFKNRGAYVNDVLQQMSNLVPHAQQTMSQPLRDFYILNEHLGSENRSTEYKSGPGFIRHGFRENVAMYICGFVNSRENGRLLIGVNDDGYVTGYDCSHHEEDGLRCDVDEAIKDLIPPIFPSDYNVRFVPVCNEYNQSLGNSKLIEISVQGSSMAVTDQLFQNKQGVFMRRDGSIQRLQAHEIQEWTRRRYQAEIDKLRKNEGNLQSELQNKRSHLQQLEEKVREKNEELLRKDFESEKRTVQLDRQKSTMNHLSDKNRDLQDENNQLKRHSEQNGAQGSSQVIERLDKMEQMLAEQGPRRNSKKSKVCVIA